MKLNTPSQDDMKRVAQIWSERKDMAHYQKEEKILKELFTQYPKNTNLDEITQKVAKLDKFYSTGLARNQISHSDMAKHILSVNFDKRVQGWDEKLVKDIATKFAKKSYSFASKYCVLHNSWVYKRDDFVIFDGLVCKKLKEFRKAYKGKCAFAEFKNADIERLENYGKYKQILENFRADFKLGCSLRDLDWYLWEMGKLGE